MNGGKQPVDKKAIMVKHNAISNGSSSSNSTRARSAVNCLDDISGYLPLVEF